MMAHRVNVMLRDDIWEQLKTLPKGERSRTVNEALAAWLVRRKRKKAIQELTVMREKLPPVEGAAEDWIREDRRRH